MTREDFNEAVIIIARHNSTQVNINTLLNHFVGDIGSATFRLHITRCEPAVLKDLVEHQYLLSMTPDGLRVEKI